MPQISGMVHDWSIAEDNLLLQYLHVSQPGGRFDGPREFARWPMISENMTATAPLQGITRSYTRELCAMRYSRYILPHMTLWAAQNRTGRGQLFADAANASETNVPYHNLLQCIANLHLEENNVLQPGGSILGDLVTWDNLLDWAKKVVENPREIFNQQGRLLEFDTNPELMPAEENPWGVKAQYELEYFYEILGWAQKIVRQSEWKESPGQWKR